MHAQDARPVASFALLPWGAVFDASTDWNAGVTSVSPCFNSDLCPLTSDLCLPAFGRFPPRGTPLPGARVRFAPLHFPALSRKLTAEGRGWPATGRTAMKRSEMANSLTAEGRGWREATAMERSEMANTPRNPPFDFSP